MTSSIKAARKLQIVLGVAAVASSLGSTASALAGPTLSNLINLTNSAELTVNNVAGQSFSVNGILTGVIKPFKNATALKTLVNTGVATLAMSGAALNPMLGKGITATFTINANIAATTAVGVVLTALSGITIKGPTSAVATVGASITNTVFGVSNVKASSAFSNQTTTSLTSF